ncbi:beta-ketoacyl synthase N-terminal-like domain-containing protein (plasmid) [Photobacterium sp. DA100]|uniref:beta-ketoacyl synthase N-terminal-like domain-containing protein n=1 Tax=Photobacterium sp. DA100 TaxID=3027472 RepID=UPI00247AFF65|nr:beta-ketoacyl synthase N-terminal-like domain-containing protein [Photobacterium sp. DA100]WEM44644.1 beta-ketoacyl synthase N-terminal-like domain-containing protein [Photobacterium sp. DA100]
MPAYLKQGQQQLPEGMGWEVFFSQASFPVTALDNNTSLGLADQAAYLRDTDLKQIEVSRIVRKTSEKQSRWVIENSVNSWRQYFGDQAGGGRAGLFLGLGTVDCDDDGEQISFHGDYNQLAREGLCQIKPLSGLTLLNSTTASHIAERLQITGVNGVYSPHADAGGNAFAEAYFNLTENQCDVALVSGGSQKITPWYFLAYQSVLSGVSAQSWCPAEAVASVLLSQSPQSAEGALLSVHRGFSANFQASQYLLDQIALQLAQSHAGTSFENPLQIIHVGLPEPAQKMVAPMSRFFPGAHQLLLDTVIGTTGPAGAAIGVNLALEILKRQEMLSSNQALSNPKPAKVDESVLKAPDCVPLNCQHVLVACYGLQGQQVFLLIGDTSTDNALVGEGKGALHG